MKRILLTGVGGFIGSHCLEYFLKNTDWEIIGLDSFCHKGTFRRVVETTDNTDRYKVYIHDLSVPIDVQLENLILDSKKIDCIINMASDSAVERSTSNPVACLKNNYNLMINMLELARKITPEIFIQISSDEVYGEAKEAHPEWDTIMPSNPYSASKAAQEAISISYWRTFDVPVVITNCTNIIGERQDQEKFLPKLIHYIVTGQEMPIYGDSETKVGSRYYLDAKSKASALTFISNLPVAMYKNGAERPDRYNISGDTELSNLQMGYLVADIIGKPFKYKIIPSEVARKGYDRRYALNGSKLRKLGWVPPLTFRESIERIVKWTLNNPHWLL